MNQMNQFRKSRRFAARRRRFAVSIAGVMTSPIFLAISSMAGLSVDFGLVVIFVSPFVWVALLITSIWDAESVPPRSLKSVCHAGGLQSSACLSALFRGRLTGGLVATAHLMPSSSRQYPACTARVTSRRIVAGSAVSAIVSSESMTFWPLWVNSILIQQSSTEPFPRSASRTQCIPVSTDAENRSGFVLRMVFICFSLARTRRGGQPRSFGW